MQDKRGFTLMEMLIVLSCISIMLLWMIIIPVDKSYLRNDINYLHTKLLEAQVNAMLHHQRVQVNILPTYVEINNDVSTFQKMKCLPCEFHYSDKGTISKANSIQCYVRNQRAKLVLQLGSGAIDVR